MRDDFAQRALVRLCCLGEETKDDWSEMRATVDALPDHEKNVLKTELGEKDGLSATPVFVPRLAGKFLSLARRNESVGLRSALLLLARIFEEATLAFSQRAPKVLRLGLDAAVELARDFHGDSFEETPFSLERLGQGDLHVRFGS